MGGPGSKKTGITPALLDEIRRWVVEVANNSKDADVLIDKLWRLLPAMAAELLRVYGKQPGRPLVTIESPYAGDVEANVAYARRALLDSIRRGEAPFAGHLLYTQVLADSKPDERALGLESHLTYVQRSTRLAVYEDRGVSSGMTKGIEVALEYGVPIEKRRLEDHG